MGRKHYCSHASGSQRQQTMNFKHSIIDVGSISAAFSSLVYVSPREESSGMSAGSFPEQRLVIEPIIDVTWMKTYATGLRHYHMAKSDTLLQSNDTGHVLFVLARSFLYKQAATMISILLYLFIHDRENYNHWRF